MWYLLVKAFFIVLPLTVVVTALALEAQRLAHRKDKEPYGKLGEAVEDLEKHDKEER